MPERLSFTRVHLSRPIETEGVARTLRRLAGSDLPFPLVFETWAAGGQIRSFVGCSKSAMRILRRHLRASMPDIEFSRENRPSVATAARVTGGRNELPVSAIAADYLIGYLYAALAAPRDGETLVLQVVLGGGRKPQYIPSDIADPLQAVGSRLLRGTKQAGSDIRNKLAQHTAEARFIATIRVGVDAAVAPRRAQLAHGLFGALQAMEAVGTTLRLTTEPPRRLVSGASGRGLPLTADELVPLLGWPIGTEELPGTDPLHPRRIRVPRSVTATESVFAVGTTTGPKRPVGLTTNERLSHLGVLSPTGSGKSESVLAPLLLSDVAAHRPVALVDPKAQLVEFVMDRLPESARDRIVLIDPSDPDGTAGFNPLDVGNRDPHAVVDSIMAVLREVFADGWGPRTEDILHAAILTLALDGPKREEPHTLLDIPRLLTDAHFRRNVVGTVAHDPALGPFWANFEQLPSAQRESMIAAPMNKLRRYMMRRNVTAILGQAKPSFRLRDIFTSDRVILVALNDALVGPIAAQLIGGLICAEIFLAAQERAREKNPKSRPGMVFVDEVAAFLHLPLPIATALEVSRSYGVGWHLFGQGRYQLGTNLAKAFEINTRSKITFATSLSEAKELAKTTSALNADDIQALPNYEIYANLLTPDGPSGWFSAKTLPPPTPLGHGEKLRAAVRRQPTPSPTEPTPATDSTAIPTTPESTHVKRRRS